MLQQLFVEFFAIAKHKLVFLIVFSVYSRLYVYPLCLTSSISSSRHHSHLLCLGTDPRRVHTMLTSSSSWIIDPLAAKRTIFTMLFFFKSCSILLDAGALKIHCTLRSPALFSAVFTPWLTLYCTYHFTSFPLLHANPFATLQCRQGPLSNWVQSIVYQANLYCTNLQP